MLLQAISGDGINMPMLVSILFVLLASTTLHEYAHCVMANWWGDPTPREMGHLTLNPMVHLYWPGILMFLLIGFGALGRAPVNPRRMRDPRWGSFWTSAAGPLTNLLIAIVVTIVFRFVSEGLLQAYLTDRTLLTEFIFYLFLFGISINVLLFVFNLLPFFPLDGWHMVLALLPARFMDRTQVPDPIRKNARPLSAFLQAPAFKWQEWAQASQFVLMILVVISIFGRNFGLPIDPLGLLISRPTSLITDALMGLGLR